MGRGRVLTPARVEVTVSAATVVKAALVALAVYAVIAAADVVVSIGLAFVLAAGLDPPVTALTRRGMRRGRAAVLVFAAGFAIVAVLVVWAATPVWNEVRRLAVALPGWVASLEDASVLADLGIAARAEELVRDAAGELPRTAAALLGATGAVVGSALSVVTLVFLTLFLTIALPDLRRGALALLPPGRAARVDRMLDAVTATISAPLLGNVAISVIAGTVVWITALIVDAPFPVVLAVIVGLFDLVPQVGSLIAAVVVGLITLAGAGVMAAAVTLVVILVYQQVENYLLQPLVYRRAVELSGFATIALVMAGGALMGVVGAVLAIPVGASLKLVLRELAAAYMSRHTTPPGTEIDAAGGDGAVAGGAGAATVASQR